MIFSQSFLPFRYSPATILIAFLFAQSVALGSTQGILAAGDRHTIVLQLDGTVLTWGDNSYGQLGNGTMTAHALPNPVPNLAGIIAVSAGARHSLALKNDGTVWAWGSNGSGQIGDGTTTQRLTPVKVNLLTNIVAVSAGNYHNLALRSDGTVWAWGSNGSGRLGDGTSTQRSSPVLVSTINNVTAIGAGGLHSLAVRSDGSVWSWGSNANGQLGDGTTTSHSTPAQVSLIVGALSVSAGSSHSLAVTTGGAVYAWGNNGSGRLGDGSSTQRTLPVLLNGLAGITDVEAGVEHSVALRSDGAVFTFGSNASGQLGNSSIAQSSTPTAVPGIGGAVSITAGFNHSAALLSNGALFTWGANDYGQIGNGVVGLRATPSIVPSLSGILQVAAGDSFAVALKSNATLVAWGENSYGQLGDGTAIDRATPVAISNLTSVTAVSAGTNHTLALKSDGTVWAWGSNGSGQLGDGTTTQRFSPVRAGSLTGIIAISAGGYHSLALKSDGTVWAWGSNGSGRLGDGTTTQRNSPVKVNLITNVTAIAGGGAHSLAVKTDGTVWVWGSNANGQLGDGTTTTRTSPVQATSLTGVVRIGAGDSHSLAITTNGSLYAWGNNGSGRLGDNTTTQRTTPVLISGVSGPNAISGGVEHSLSLTSSGLAYAWGDNLNAQLGDGTYTQRNTPNQIASLSSLTALTAGGHFSLALTSSGQVITWGSNDFGQIGDGTTGIQWSPVQVASIVGSDQNGLPDAWEINYFGHTGVDPNADPDGDGITNLQEYQYGTDPTHADPDADGDRIPDAMDAHPNDYYNAVLPSLRIVNGENQMGLASWVLPLPIVVEVDDGQGQPLQNAPLQFSVAATGAGLSSAASGTFNSTVSIRTGTDGRGYAYIHLPDNPTSFTITISAVSGTNTATVNASEEAINVSITSPALAAGDFHTVALGSNGMVWAWGLNSSGQLGDGTTLNRSLPSQVVGLRNVTKIAAGEYHTLALTGDGHVIAWGDNHLGELGTGDFTNTSSFKAVLKADGTSLSGVVAIVAGSYHSLALTSDGKVFAWGLNASGQLGLGNTATQNRAVQVPDLTGITAIAAGGYHSIAVTGNGTLVGWGGNFYGALGGDIIVQSNSPTAILSQLTNVTKVAGGAYHSMFVLADGTVIAAGWNGYGQLGDDSTISRSSTASIQNISSPQILTASLLLAGHCGATTLSGITKTWGGNTFGQVGDGTTSDAHLAQTIVNLPQIVAFATGGYHTVALAADGSIYGWGYNAFGQLGMGTTDDESTAVRKPGFGLLPRADDIDGDNLPDVWEMQYFGDLDQVGDGDSDGDGLMNLQEYQQAHNPTAADNVAINASSSLSQLVNGSGRAPVAEGQNAITGTFVIQGDAPKRLMIRAIGPSLQNSVSTYLPDPQLQLLDSGGAVIASNDNWQVTQIGGLIVADQVADIQASGLAPAYSSESALIVEVLPGTYTAVIQTATNDSGVALFEVYDLDAASGQVVSVSARARLSTGDNVLIGGFIIDGSSPLKVLVRALGPTLTSYGIADALQDPILELHDGAGTAFIVDDDWRDSQQKDVIASGFPPPDNREPAVVSTLTPGNYTAVVRGKNATVGVALIEVYVLPDPSDDTDGNGLPDWWETLEFGHIGINPNADPDGDGLTNAQELALGTSPTRSDSDGDGVPDGQDAFPLDPTRSLPPSVDPNDHTAPTIMLITPRDAVLLP